MKSTYILIKKSEITIEMLNRSVSNNLKHLPVMISKEKLLGIFPINTEFYVLEVENSRLLNTSIFDKYTWYTIGEITELLKENN